MHLTRKDDEGDYTETVPYPDLVKYGYSKWFEITNIIMGHQGIQSQELKIAQNLMMNKVQNVNIIPTHASTLTSTSRPPFSVSSDNDVEDLRMHHSSYLMVQWLSTIPYIQELSLRKRLSYDL